MKTIAVILAGGTGTRIGGELPKQLLPLEDKPMVIHSLQTFDKHQQIDEIILIINKDFKTEFDDVLSEYKISKLTKVVFGGKERSDSTRSALRHIASDSETCVLIHDSARPFLCEDIISRIMETLRISKVVNVAIPVTDTVLEVNNDNEIINIPAREKIYLVQTPQGFRADIIHRAYDLAANDEYFKATDDCSVVHTYCPEIPIKIVQGNVNNKKITYPSDLK